MEVNNLQEQSSDVRKGLVSNRLIFVNIRQFFLLVVPQGSVRNRMSRRNVNAENGFVPGQKQQVPDGDSVHFLPLHFVEVRMMLLKKILFFLLTSIQQKKYFFLFNMKLLAWLHFLNENETHIHNY